jgi:hypothetical protein
MNASITAGFQCRRRQFHVTGSLNVGIVVAVVGFPDRVGNDRGGGDGTWFGSSDATITDGMGQWHSSLSLPKRTAF